MNREDLIAHLEHFSWVDEVYIDAGTYGYLPICLVHVETRIRNGEATITLTPDFDVDPL